jgi:hypothetical protein
MDNIIIIIVYKQGIEPIDVSFRINLRGCDAHHDQKKIKVAYIVH